MNSKFESNHQLDSHLMQSNISGTNTKVTRINGFYFATEDDRPNSIVKFVNYLSHISTHFPELASHELKHCLNYRILRPDYRTHPANFHHLVEIIIDHNQKCHKFPEDDEIYWLESGMYHIENLDLEPKEHIFVASAPGANMSDTDKISCRRAIERLAPNATNCLEMTTEQKISAVRRSINKLNSSNS